MALREPWSADRGVLCALPRGMHRRDLRGPDRRVATLAVSGEWPGKVDRRVSLTTCLARRRTPANGFPAYPIRILRFLILNV